MFISSILAAFSFVFYYSLFVFSKVKNHKNILTFFSLHVTALYIYMDFSFKSFFNFA